MASDKQRFDLVGPMYLTVIDWENEQHRTSVAACLVKSVSVSEGDRQEKRERLQALAPLWWQFFQFHLVKNLIDSEDSSIFGAIYKNEAPPSSGGHSLNEPRYVIAFRGTMTKGESTKQDLMLNLRSIRHRLHQTPRFETAMQAVRDTVALAGDSRVWIVGHSLGAAIATLAGKTMAKTGISIECFLFNPPFFSLPIEQIPYEKLRHGCRFAKSFITAGLSIAMKGPQVTKQSQDPFAAMAAWVPRLYVNPADPICSEYIGYFKHRRKMEKIGAGRIEKLSTQHSIRALIMTARGKEAEPVHLIPSAVLTVNRTPCSNFRSAHGIYQWWNPNLNLQSELYRYGWYSSHRCVRCLT